MRRLYYLFIFILIALSISSCSKPASTVGFAKDAPECEARIAQGLSEIDYTKYLSIEIQPFKYGESTDETFKEVLYNIRFENISDKDIVFGARIYKPQKISDISLYPGPLEDSLKNTVVLKPGKGYRCNVSTQILKNSPLSDKQIDTLLKQYIFEINIDGKMSYLKLEGESPEIE